MTRRAREEQDTPIFESWVAALENYKPQKLDEQESAQLERSKIYDEQSKAFNFVLGGKINFNF